MGADIGGYKGSPEADLLTKWLELGAFNPIDRDHTEKGTADQEPWVHGPQHEAIRKRYIEERYRLLLYIYTSMEQATRDGIPLMRPMFLEYSDQEPLITEGAWANNQYLFGHDLLVAPEPYEFLQDFRVMLPSGNLWYDYWTGKMLQPGDLTVKPALDILHVYVRGGAIIPRQPANAQISQNGTSLWFRAQRKNRKVHWNSASTQTAPARGRYIWMMASVSITRRGNICASITPARDTKTLCA